ncbi:MAG: hypothetical protein RLZZ507_4054 [Cyanobacteriota bacterium]|jgi:uncharacterized membrane protein YecN with MAPEG domain
MVENNIDDGWVVWVCGFLLSTYLMNHEDTKYTKEEKKRVRDLIFISLLLGFLASTQPTNYYRSIILLAADIPRQKLRAVLVLCSV